MDAADIHDIAVIALCAAIFGYLCWIVYDELSD